MVEEGFIPTGIPDDDILLEETGRELSAIAAEDINRSAAWADGSGEQLASLPGWLASRLSRRRKITAPSTDLLLKEGLEASQKPPPDLQETLDTLIPEPLSVAIDEAVPQGKTPFDETVPEVDGQTYAERLAEQEAAEQRRTWARNINLDYVESEEDIGKVLDLNAEIIGEAEHRSFDEIEAADIRESLAPILQGKQNGLLTDRQLYAGRRLLVSMTERIQKMIDPITEGQATPEEILEFEKLQGQTVMLQKYMQGQIRETARALNSMRINAKALNAKSTDAIMDTINSTDVTATATVKAQILRNALEARADDDPAAVLADAAAGMNDKNTVRALANYWSASILTGFKTQATNIVSNAFVQMLETMVLKPMAAGIGGVRRTITGSTDGVSGAETYYEALGARHALKDAFLMASTVFMNGVRSGEYRSSYGQRKIDDITRQAPSLSKGLHVGENVAGKSLDLFQRMVEAGSYGLLTAGDEFFKTIAYRKVLYATAAREGYEKGLRGDDLAEFMNQKLNNVDEDMHKTALAEAERQTFTNEPQGNLGIAARYGIKPVVQRIPILKFIMPFVDTPLNLFNYALEIGPTAPLTKRFRERIMAGGADRDIAIAQLSFGVTATAMLAVMHQEGSITGGGPANFGQRKALEKEGWKPYSILIDGQWVSYNRGTDPLGMMMSAVTGYMDEMNYARDEGTASQMYAAAVFSMAAYAKDATYLRGIGEIMKVIDNKGKGADRYAARMLAGFVPSAFKTYQELVSDDVVRTTYPSAGFWDALSKQMDLRFDRETLTPLRYWDGDIVTYGNGNGLHIYNSLSPININARIEDKASERMVTNGVSVLPPKPIINIAGVRLNLLESDKGDELYDKYLEMVGKGRRYVLDKVVNNKSFDKADDGPSSTQARLINKALDTGRRKGQAEFVQYLFKEVGQNVEEYGDIAEYFDKDTLKSLIKRARAGTLTLEEEEAITTMKIRGVKTREGIKVPGYLGF
jgi:hypothetical protein